MAQPDFNQKNVDLKISEIKALPDKNREQIASEVKADIRTWLLDNFTFTQEQQSCMDKWPKSMREETGFGIGTALQYKEWELTIKFPDGSKPQAARKKQHEQSVSGEYDTSTGGYTVKKVHTWKW